MSRNLPPAWQWAKFGDIIAESQAGFASGQRDSKGVIQLRMNNVDIRGNLIWDEFLRVPAEQKAIEKFGLKFGDVVFNNTNSTELVGKSALFTGYDEPVTYSNHFTRLRAKPDVADPGFITFWLISQWQAKTFANICNRWIGQSAVKTDKLFALEIPLPPLDEQRRIASRLNEQLAAVESARKAAEEQLHAAWDLPSAYLMDVFANKEAKGWKKESLGKITRLTSGGTPSRGNIYYYDGDIAWVKTLDLNLDYVLDTEEKISEDAFKAIRGELLPEGTVMVAMYGGAGTIGKSGILGIRATTNQAICSILPNSSVFVPEFLHAYLMHIRAEWMKFSSGNRKDPNINKGIVAQMKVPIPDLVIQNEVADYLRNKKSINQNLIETLESQLAEIESLPASLLREAFAGHG